MYILALLFTLVYLFVTVANVGAMVHSSSYFPAAVLVYLPLSIGLTWLAARSLRTRNTISVGSWAVMSAIGVGLAAVGASLWSTAADLERFLDAKQAAAVVVTPTEETVFHSRSGNPIGLKLVFTARVPSDDWYNFREPSMGISRETSQTLGKLTSGTWPSHALVMKTYREEVAPPLEKSEWFERGVDYTLTYYLLPSYVVDSPTNPMPCIWVPEDFPADTWKAVLSSEWEGTYRLSPIIGAYDPNSETRGRYSQRMFFDGLRRESLSLCPPSGRSPGSLSAFPGIF